MSESSKKNKVTVPENIATDKHDGHALRTGTKTIVDRKRLSETPVGHHQKKPNQYDGHTFLNKPAKYRLDGHKMLYHLDRVLAWQRGERIAPIHIDMGLTKFCNVGCIFCMGVTQGGMKKGEFIDPKALLKFIDDASRLKVRSIAFIGDGEPTLNPGLYDAIVRAAEVGVETAMATNGVPLRMDRAHDVLKNQTFVRFTICAGERNVYERIHQTNPKDFDRVVEKISALTKLRAENNYKCTIGLQMVLIPENFDQLVPLAELGVKLNVDYLQIKQCSDTEYKELGINPEDYRAVQDTLRQVEKLSTDDYAVKVKWHKINIFDDTEVYKEGFRKYDICYGTPFLGQISGNGKVYPCGPFFAKDRFLQGDIHTDSYYDIVHSDRYWEVQKDIVDNVDVHHDCTVGCRQDYLNKFLWDIMNPPQHINFI
ncbi:MAG: radical SAM protein [Pseudomonadota bacterium]